MIAIKLNYLIERAIIVFICLWGNWALYYWAVVLIGNGSYTNLKGYAPILLLQIVVSLLVFLRVDLGISKSHISRCTPSGWLAIGYPGKRFLLLSLTATVFAIAVVYSLDFYSLTKSSLGYNFFWAILLPVFLAYLLHFKSPKIGTVPQETFTETGTQIFDILLLFIAAGFFVFSLYGTNFPSYDDAFYAHVISSTLGNPELPIQGQDLLLRTDAPFTLHPAYRVVGYEVLIAWLSDISGLNPLDLYYDVFPCINAIFWILAAYLFMRTLGTPYPGIAVTVSLLMLMFWGGGRFAPGMPLMFLNWGKNLLILLAAPLLFVFVSVFIRSQNIRTWCLLFLSVSSLGILSSTALFLVPVCVGLACIVFLAPKKANFLTLFFTLCSLAPFVLFMVYTVVMLKQAPANTSGFNAGFITVQGEAFGGITIQALILVMLLVLPLAARTIGNSVFQINLYKVSLVGIFTVMSPYLLEAIAVLTGTKLLSVRLQYAYPTMLLVGVMAGIAIAHLKPYEGTPTAKHSRYAVFAITLALYGALFGFLDKHYLFGEWRKALVIFTSDFDEAKAARALIPDGSFVAAGDMDDILPIFPNPPSFIQSKYYLSFQKNFLSRDEFRNRSQLYQILQNRLPRKGESFEDSLDWIVSTSESLGVTTIVFHTVGGRHRPYILTKGIAPRSKEIDSKRSAFVKALTARLRTAGYDCTATPSGRSWVCNNRS